MSSLLLTTKLYIPRLRTTQRFVARPRLVIRLNQGLDNKLTLISAPAGFGKTTLLAEWIPQSDRCVCWISLDEADNDLIRFLTYLITALQMLKPDFGQTSLLALQAPQPPPVESVMTTLVNEIAHTLTDFALVLDDYHLIHLPAIHAAVAFLLNNLPPNVHLIMASRADPPLSLARLRVRGQLTELRAADLRFTLEEVTALFQQIKALALPAEQIKELERRTEGWGAGLQLATLSLQGLDTTGISRFIQDFAGSHHYVFDYLAEEVLHQQPEEIRDFLLHTSILSRLCGPLCDAVLGKGAEEQGNRGENPTGQEVLEYLEHANLFLVPLDGERRWYRYHHLFADFLKDRLTRKIGLAGVNELNRYASGWFEQHGLPQEAVQHALAAGDGTLAARLIEPLARPMQLRGEMTTVMGWLAALPEAELRARPQLGLIYAWGLTTAGQVLAAEHWLQTMEHDLTALGDRGALLGEVTMIRARLALIRGEYPRVIELARQTLAYLPEDQLLLRAQTHVSLGSACIPLAHMETARQSFTQASILYQASGQPLMALLPLRQLARVQLAQGHLNQLYQSTQEALQLAAGAGQRSPLMGYTYISLGELWYERNDLAAAGRYFTDGLALVELGGTKDVLNLMNLVNAYLGLAQLKQTQGDPEGAQELIRRIEPIWGQLTRSIQPPSDTENVASSEQQAELGRSRPGLGPLYVDVIAACQVRLWLSQGNLSAASQWAQSKEGILEGEITFFQEVSFTTVVRVLIAQGQYERALGLLARLLDATEAVGRIGRVIELLALQALALHAQKRESEALAALERALALAEPEGYIRTFVDEGPLMAQLLLTPSRRSSAISRPYLEILLAAFPDFELPISPRSPGRGEAGLDATGESKIQHPAIGTPPETGEGARSKIHPPLIEPLSRRELEILALMAQGLTNIEIGQQIFISAQTVKVHTRNIYGKLGVNSRRQAVTKARALGLL